MSKRPFSLGRLERLLTRPRTFWRHDVDYSLMAAEEMASLEYNLDVSSTFYLMTDSPFYSAADALVFAAEAGSCYHNVGWHIDPRNYTPTTLVSSTEVSFHCPRPSELWVRFPGFKSAYDPIWEGSYYSDSRGRFAHGDPEDHPDQTIQVNLHPEWWFDPDWSESVDDLTYEAFFHEPKSEL